MRWTSTRSCLLTATAGIVSSNWSGAATGSAARRSTTSWCSTSARRRTCRCCAPVPPIPSWSAGFRVWSHGHALRSPERMLRCPASSAGSGRCRSRWWPIAPGGGGWRPPSFSLWSRRRSHCGSWTARKCSRRSEHQARSTNWSITISPPTTASTRPPPSVCMSGSTIRGWPPSASRSPSCWGCRSRSCCSPTPPTSASWPG